MGIEIFGLEGKVALVTGASRGLGKTMALALAEAGADVVVVSRSPADLELTAAEIRGRGRRALVVKTDVTRAGEVEGLAARALEEFGHIDILINNSGISGEKEFLKLSEGEWDEVLDINLKGVFLCTQVVGRHMVERRRGKVINMASAAALVGVSHLAAYCASKGGVLQLTRALALEWAKYNIQVNAICPGYIATPLNEAFAATEAGQQFIRRAVPMRRMGRPDDLAGIAIYLASEASNYVTGAAFVLDGGQTAG